MKLHLLRVGPALCLACLPEMMAAPEPPRFLGLESEGPVLAEEPVHLVFSRPVRMGEEESPFEVRRRDGRGVPIRTEDFGLSARWPLYPLTAWPLGEWLSVEIGKGLVDERGQPLASPESPVQFDTLGSNPDASVELRMPRPTEAWPPNIRYVAVALIPPDLAVEELRLRGTGKRIPLQVLARDQGRLLLQLPEYQGPCASLCPGASYELEVEWPGFRLLGPEVHTSTVTDDLGPTLEPREPVRRGATFYVDIASSEPVVFTPLVLGHRGADDRIPEDVLDRLKEAAND